MYHYRITLVPLDGGESEDVLVAAPHMIAALLGAKEARGHGKFYVAKAEQVEITEVDPTEEVVAVFGA